jgi:hypothetical protein
MPVRIKKVGKKFRVVESSTGKIVKKGGKAVDGGGRSRGAAIAQAHAINLSTLRKKGRKGIPPARKKRK